MSMRLLLDLYVAAVGLVIGSYLNVVIHRLPREESTVLPRSRCPRCGAPLRARDNLPLVSFLLLRGRCRQCQAPISWRYPLVEAGTGLLCALVVVAKGADEDAILGLVLVLLLVPITLIDLDYQIIPNKITYPGVVVGIAIVALTDLSSLDENLIAAFIAGGFLFVAWFLRPGGMGLGDVKLAFMLGIYLGRAVAPAMFAALISGSLIGAVIIARYGAAKGRKMKIPFGPYLALGGIVGLFAGDEIVEWYLDSFT